LEWIKKITQTNLFKITSLNSVSILIKIGIGLVTSKLLAVFVGPTGMALVGNLRNFLTSLESISTLGFQNGIVKYVAENENNKTTLEKTIATLLISFLAVAFFLSTLIFIFSDYLCYKIFGDNLQYEKVFKLVAIILPWNVVSVLVVSIINGLGKYNKVIFAGIITNVATVMLAAGLMYYFDTLGALLSLVIVPVISVIVTFYYLPKEIQIFKRLNFCEYDFNILKNFIGFSLMILPPAILSPIFNLQTRNFLIATVGLQQSGLWEAMTRISNLYLIFVGTMISVYFYPQLIKAKETNETKKVIWSFYTFILPFFVIGAVLIYFSRFVIIKLLFTDEFLPVSNLFFLQLTGDFFKVCGMILGVLLMAQKRIFHYILIEVVAILFLYATSLFCIKNYGIEGVVMAQAFENFLYLLVLGWYFRKKIF
jgi:PST family polysaccharide transporter